MNIGCRRRRRVNILLLGLFDVVEGIVHVSQFRIFVPVHCLVWMVHPKHNI
jgi:hypothetical protein